MKFIALALFTLFAMSTAVTAPQKAVIVSYPDDTPDSVIDQAKDAIKKAGGVITHEYQLIKGFAAQANAKILTTVQTMNTQYNAIIEEDQMVSINP